MQTQYRVTLKSPDSRQRRFVTLSADNDEHAASLCEGMERELAAYTLDATELERQSVHVGTGITDPGGLVKVTIDRTYS